MNEITQKMKMRGLLGFRKSFITLCSVGALTLSSTIVNAQCDPGVTAVNIVSSGGDYPSEKWVNITTESNGEGTVVWQQGPYGSGGLVNADICLTPGVYYVNAYDMYSDGWDGTRLTVSSYGQNYFSELVPNDPNSIDESSTWEPINDGPNPSELEGSYMITVEAPPSCLPPTNLTSSNATLSSIDLSWVGEVGQTGDYELVWGPVGFDVETAIPISLSETNYTINVTGGDYEFAVRQYCGTTDVSSWSSKQEFRINLEGEDCSTPILVSNLPYTSTDDTANYSDNPAIEGTPGTNCGTTSSYLNGNDVVYSYIADFTGVIRVGLSELTQNYAGVFAYDSCEAIGVNCIGGSYNAFSTADTSFDLAVTEGEDYFIVISTWATPQTVGYTLTISELACPSPMNITIDNITLNSADVSWFGAEEGSYEINWGTGNFTAGEGISSETIIGTTFTIEDLNSTTNYRFYVRRLCGEEGQSEWMGPYTFETQVTPAQAPWTEGFATTDTPVGWTISSLSIQETNTRVPNLDGAFIAGNLYSFVPSGTFTTLPITNIQSGFELSFNYLISDWTNYPAQPDANSLSIAVNISTDDGANYTTIQTLTNDGTTQGWQDFVYDMSAYVGETVRIQIVSTHNADDFMIAFDNISILGPPCTTAAPTGDAIQTLAEGQTLADLAVTGTDITWYSDADLTTEIPSATVAVNGTTYYATQTVDSCESTTALAITVDVTLKNNELDLVDLKVYPNPTKDVINIDYKDVITKVEIYDLNGRQIVSQVLNANTNTLSVSSLSSGTYLMKIETKANEVSIVKFVKK